MKENKYDNELFFQKYSQMLRSQKGLQGAGEWSELQKIFPDFSHIFYDSARRPGNFLGLFYC